MKYETGNRKLLKIIVKRGFVGQADAMYCEADKQSSFKMNLND